MNNFLDDLVKVIILFKNRVVSWYNSQADSVFTFVSKYEKRELEKVKEYETEKTRKVKSSSCQGTYEEDNSLKDCSNFDKESDCYKQSGCTWDETESGFDIKPSPYLHTEYYSCSGAYCQVFPSCASSKNYNYIARYKIKGGEQVYNSKGECKNFYYKRYKSRENYENAVLKFIRKY